MTAPTTKGSSLKVVGWIVRDGDLGEVFQGYIEDPDKYALAYVHAHREHAERIAADLNRSPRPSPWKVYRVILTIDAAEQGAR